MSQHVSVSAELGVCVCEKQLYFHVTGEKEEPAGLTLCTCAVPVQVCLCDVDRPKTDVVSYAPTLHCLAAS
jgi:hypothetical protein